MTSLAQAEQGLPQSVYYPSLVANLQIRFDEGLELIPGATTPEELAASPTPGAEPIRPKVIEPGSDNLSKLVGIVPKSASVELPGYRQAGNFSLEMAFRDLPLDPRVIRAIAVAIHLDAVPAGDFADGMTRVQLFGDSRFESNERRPSIIETNEENILLAGLADTIKVEHSSSGSSVRIDGRDLRGILLDTPISPSTLKAVDLKKNIKEVVAQLVNKLHPQGTGIEVTVKEDEWPNKTIPSPATLDDVTRINLDAAGKSLKPNAKGEAQEINFWDLITQYCFLVGGVPHFVGSKLRIRPARSLFDARRQEEAFDPNFPTPFKDGEQRSVRAPFTQRPEQFAFRRLVFGRDINKLNWERKLGGVKVPVIETVSYDTSGSTRGTGRLLKAQWPEPTKKEARTTSVGASGKTPQTDVVRINVPGVNNKERLLEIAKDLYQEIGRQEIGGSVDTKNLASFGGNNQDPDLVRLRPGDPIEFRVDASGLGVFPPPISELTQEAGRSFEEQVKVVKDRIGDEDLARVLVAVNRGEVSQLQKVFRTANVKFDWSAGSGVGISFDFQNFLEARYAVEDETGL